MPRFKDAPLRADYFRLFRFKQAPLRFEVEVQTFKIYKAPTYEAISYCWGDKSDGVDIILCNEAPLEVWRNLSSVLRRLHRENSGSWYWNDAICIEQGDEEIAKTEKLRQIAFMETIFRLAKPVKAWLGDATEQEERAFRYLTDRCALAVEKNMSFADTGLPGPRDDIWRFWSQILLRPWFTRLWICQEALISAGNLVIMLGKDAHTTWSIFCQTVDRAGQVPWIDEPLEYNSLDIRVRLDVDRDFAVDWGITVDDYQKAKFSRNDAVQSCLYRNIVNIQEIIFLDNYNDEKWGFLPQILKVFGNRRCTFDQDRPNAMRGLLTDQLKKGLKSYSPDADVPTVYREVSRLWLTNDPTLSLLQRIRPLGQFLPHGYSTSGTKLTNPSWTIDLGRVVTEALGRGIPNRIDGFHAGLSKTTSMLGKQEWNIPEIDILSKFKGTKHVTFPIESECHISGVVIGVVKSVVYSNSNIRGLQPTSPSITTNYYAELKQWIDQTLSMIKSTGVNENTAEETHWRTLVLNIADVHAPEVKSMFDYENKHSWREAYLAFTTLLNSNQPELLQHAEGVTKRYYSTVFRDHRDFPTWFCTDSGYVGRSFAVSKPGDVVAVFYGAATPFLLRPTQTAEKYQLMGEAYCHGVMQGEALLKENRSRHPKKVFMLV